MTFAAAPPDADNVNSNTEKYVLGRLLTVRLLQVFHFFCVYLFGVTLIVPRDRRIVSALVTRAAEPVTDAGMPSR